MRCCQCMMQQDKKVYLLEATHYNFSFILIYAIFNSINSKLARVASLLKPCQQQEVYSTAIHTDLLRSVERTEMDINGKVCMSVNVCVGAFAGA